jgi:hypothetical protein
MRKISLVIILLMFLPILSSCSTVQKNPDAVRTALYTLKQSWTEIRTYVMSEYVEDRITEEELQNFKNIDSQFSLYYNTALELYLSDSQNSSEELNNTLSLLERLVLNARKKYYNR